MDDQQNLENMIKVLKPFKDASKKLSADLTLTLPAVYPTLWKLKGGLNEFDDDTDYIKIARDKLNSRYSDIPHTILFASFLHLIQKM